MADSLVIAFPVVMLDVLKDGMAKVSFPQGNELAQALILDRANEAFAVGVEVRASGGQAHRPNTGRCQYVPERVHEHRSPVMDQKPFTPQKAVEDIGKIPGDLTHPRPIGFRADAGDVNASARQFHHNEHMVAHQPPERPNLHGEEVRCGEMLPVCVEERAPAPMTAPLGCGFHAMRLEDAADCRIADMMAVISLCALDAVVAPILVLGRHANNHCPNLFHDPGTTRPSVHAAVVLAGNQLAMPAQQRIRRHQGVHLAENTSAQFPGLGGQAPALIICESRSLPSELLSEHTTLLLQVVDDQLLLMIEPARQGDHHEVPWVNRHPAMLSA